MAIFDEHAILNSINECMFCEEDKDSPLPCRYMVERLIEVLAEEKQIDAISAAKDDYDAVIDRSLGKELFPQDTKTDWTQFGAWMVRLDGSLKPLGYKDMEELYLDMFWR